MVNWADYGITRDHIEESLNYTIVTVVLGIVVVTALGITNGFKNTVIDWPWVLFYVLISVPIQEFVFRGVIQTKLYRFAGVAPAIFIASALYSFIHYPNFLLIGITFPAGLVWGYSFYKHPNLLGVIISHAILGLYLFLLVM